jgi:hypothetical protein
MKKNTKILLGLGAVIAAYLILKPKMVKASNNKTLPSKVNMPSSNVCPDGYIEEVINCISAPCPRGGCRLATIKEQEEYKLQIQLRDLQSKVIPYNNNPYYNPWDAHLNSRTPDYVMTSQEMEACNQDPRNCKM